MQKSIFALFGSTAMMLLATSCSNGSPEPQTDSATQAKTEGAATYTMKSGGANEADKGKEIGFVYEAYLSPWQEGGEEKDTPKSTPSQFKSTTPSRLRKDRKDRGHGKLSFTKDLSKGIVEVEVADVNIADVNMFHIHCGRPSMLGPIAIDFSLATDIQKNFNDDGVLALEFTNEDVEAVVNKGKDNGLVAAFTMGCPIAPGLKDKFTTVGGIQYLAEQGDLYFNLHTTGESYFGDIRGQMHRISATEDTDAIEWKVAPQDAPAPDANSEMHHH